MPDPDVELLRDLAEHFSRFYKPPFEANQTAERLTEIANRLELLIQTRGLVDAPHPTHEDREYVISLMDRLGE